MYNIIFGKSGEIKAAKFLRKNGYKILETNFKTPISEIDIIALDKKVLCFVEVKTRKSDAFGTPAEAVDFKKQRKIIQGAYSYLKNSETDFEIRFDIVEVYADKNFKNVKFNLIKNAFDNSF